MQNSWQKYLAEGFATFGFVFVAAGAGLANWQSGGALGTVGVALAAGLMLAAMIYSVVHISGAHINPAITIAMLATGHIKAMTAVWYVVSQLIGSIVAALLLQRVFIGMSPQYYWGDTVLGPGITPGMAILIEAALTFLLVWTFFATLVDKKAISGFGALAVGAVLAVSTMVGEYSTMAALNPARSFGPALISSHWSTHYVYWVGPIVGALIAAAVYHFGFLRKQGG